MKSSEHNNFDFVPDFKKLDELDQLPSIMEGKDKKENQREWVKILQLSGEHKTPHSRHVVVELETHEERKYVSITEIAYDDLGGLCKIANTEIPLNKWDELTSFVTRERKFEEK